MKNSFLRCQPFISTVAALSMPRFLFRNFAVVTFRKRKILSSFLCFIICSILNNEIALVLSSIQLHLFCVYKSIVGTIPTSKSVPTTTITANVALRRKLWTCCSYVLISFKVQLWDVLAHTHTEQTGVHYVHKISLKANVDRNKQRRTHTKRAK